MTIKIYKPSKTSMQSGFKKTKLWLAEYISDVEKVIIDESGGGQGVVPYLPLNDLRRENK